MKLNATDKRLVNINSSRGKLYGKFERIGKALACLFPDGIELSTPDEFNRFVYFVFIANKMSRIASANFPKETHIDSLDDVAVYAMMLKAFEEEEAE